MSARILVAGGYGLVGGTFARLVRAGHAEVEIVLAGRRPEQGEALAAALGRSAVRRLDLDEAEGLDDLGSFDLVVAALYDPTEQLLQASLAQGAAFAGITTLAETLAPVLCTVLAGAPRRPVALLGHCAAGVATLVALGAASRFARVESLAVTALYDPADPVGPMTAADPEALVRRALLRSGGRWTWVEGPSAARSLALGEGQVVEALPTGLLDAPSLAAATGTPEARLDLAVGESRGTRAGGPASSDVYVDIQGWLPSGERQRSRTLLSDPKGLAHMTAVGMLVAAERLLGLDGQPPAAAALYFPETLLSPEAAVARYAAAGLQIVELS